ncbi:hypothetical protein KC19_4G181700 [Ceratodon purpureus]|uniref:Uncharacterized protein n=1 Tax=Ceratodon purpureus TaxID=3225 RepID=A0A8T0IAV6_CERPU|nr:hypothetical protein KC19_4G181700 [Ceratodon purpureus]
MEHVFMFARLSLCALLFFSPSYGANGAPILRPRVQAELPPCEDVPGGIQNWDCYDPPLTAFPPCDFKHQNPGIDCSTDTQKPWPSPASEEKALTDISPADFASTHYIQSTSTPSGSAHHFQGMLPSCKDNWGGIPGWDCFDPPTTLLPLCDFKHQRAGFDCWPRDDPPGARP